MTDFGTMRLPATPDVVAPDGSDVRVLLALRGGSAVAVTMPPWPGDGEEYEVEGKWPATSRQHRVSG